MYHYKTRQAYPSIPSSPIASRSLSPLFLVTCNTGRQNEMLKLKNAWISTTRPTKSNQVRTRCCPKPSNLNKDHCFRLPFVEHTIHILLSCATITRLYSSLRISDNGHSHNSSSTFFVATQYFLYRRYELTLSYQQQQTQLLSPFPSHLFNQLYYF